MRTESESVRNFRTFTVHVLILKIFFNSLELVQLSFENDLYPFPKI